MIRDNREYRSMPLLHKRAEAEPEENYIVEGHAATYDEYLLFNDGMNDFYERIDPHAFDNTDMSDVVFRVDHEGPVYARSSAGTIELGTDEHGLWNKADLGRTRRGRELYEDIAAGNYPQMSFAFTVAEDHIERDTNTRVIDRIAKVFDVSPVSFPANPGTSLSVSTRARIDGEIEARAAERRLQEEREEQIKRIKILAEV